MTIFIYRYVYELLPNVQSRLPFSNAVWSMSMYFAVFWLGLRNIERIFRQDIISGNIELYLLRPMNYIWQKVFLQLGRGLIPFVLALILSVSINASILGTPAVHIPISLWIIGLAIIFVLSQILTCLIFVLCGLAGFWLQNSEPIYFVVSKLIMIFGGAWVPVAFFPHVLQRIAEFSPFGAAMEIAYAMYPNFAERFWIMVLNTVVWIIICTLLVLVISNRAVRKLSVNG